MTVNLDLPFRAPWDDEVAAQAGFHYKLCGAEARADAAVEGLGVSRRADNKEGVGQSREGGRVWAPA